MGMVFGYTYVSDLELEQIKVPQKKIRFFGRKDRWIEKRLWDFLDNSLDKNPDHTTDVDKSWDIIHYLLTKKSMEQYFHTVDTMDRQQCFLFWETPLSDSAEASSYNSPAKVKEIVKQLKNISPDTFKENYDFQDMLDQSVYLISTESEEMKEDDISYALQNFLDLKSFYEKAEADGLGVIVSPG